MSEKVICDKEDLTAIANAVRTSTGSSNTYTVSELSVAAVSAIENGGSADAVLYIEQTLTEEQKEQARTNISAVSEDELQESVNEALEQAKASGEFDGNDGYIPVRGVDYYTDADQEDIVQQVIAALGTPVFGRVDENKHITLSGHLADGTYTIRFEDTDGFATDVCTIEKAPKPLHTNILTVYELQLNKRWSASAQSWIDCNGMLSIKVPIADVKDKTIRWRGFPKGIQASGQHARWYSCRENNVSSAGTFVGIYSSGNQTDDVWNSKVVDEGNNTFSIAYNSTNMNNYSNAVYTNIMMNMPVKESEAITEADIANLIMVIDEQIPV